MEKVYLVMIKYHRNAHGNDFQKRQLAKVFSTEEKAEEFLMKLGFVYGTPYPFRIAGWYHYKTKKHANFEIYDVFDYIEATIDTMAIDKGTEWKGISFFDAFISDEEM